MSHTLTLELPTEAADFDRAELSAVRQAAQDAITAAVSYNLSHRGRRSVTVETHSGLWFAACPCGWQGHTQPRTDAVAELIAHEAEHGPEKVAERVTVPLFDDDHVQLAVSGDHRRTSSQAGLASIRGGAGL